MKFLDEISINKYKINKVSEPFIIAEISANHNNNLDRAKKLVSEVAKSGAQAVKFQTYTADTITLNSNKEDFLIHNGLWKNKNLYELYTEGSLPYEWHSELFSFSKSLGLAVISTPFDETAVDFLINNNVDALKIASFELGHIPLLKKVAGTKLPVLMSTGMGDMKEIEEAVETLYKFGTRKLILLHCISSYPASPEGYDLQRIKRLQKKFKIPVGLSDHCLENNVAIASIALGACVIEKHFTLDRNSGGLDDSFSILPHELKELKRISCDVKKSLNKPNQKNKPDNESKQFRRSIYASKSIKKNELFTSQNIKVIRPGHGLHPRFYELLIGTQSNRDINYAEALNKYDLYNKES